MPTTTKLAVSFGVLGVVLAAGAALFHTLWVDVGVEQVGARAIGHREIRLLTLEWLAVLLGVLAVYLAARSRKPLWAGTVLLLACAAGFLAVLEVPLWEEPGDYGLWALYAIPFATASVLVLLGWSIARTGVWRRRRGIDG